MPQENTIMPQENTIMHETGRALTTVGRDIAKSGTATDGPSTDTDDGYVNLHSTDGSYSRLSDDNTHQVSTQEYSTDSMPNITFTTTSVSPTQNITEVPENMISPDVSPKSESMDGSHLEIWAKFNIQETESANFSKKIYPNIYTERTLLLGRVLRSVKMENTDRNHKGRNKSKKKNKKGRML